MNSASYAFRPMTADDLPLANAWRRTPEVARWWDDTLDADDLADPTLRCWIVSLDGAPFAYLQDYDPHAEAGHPFAFLPPGSRGIDQFIGEPGLIGRGHGSAFIDAFARRLLAEGAPAVGADPHPDNARAIRAYGKAGFAPGDERDTPWGRALLMTRYAPPPFASPGPADAARRSISPELAVFAGVLFVNVTVLLLMLGCPLLLHIAIGSLLSAKAALIISAGTFPVFWIFAWLSWSFLVPRWRLWAYQRVTDIDKTKKLGIEANLIWPEGHFFERTEIRTPALASHLRALEAKKSVLSP